MFTFYGDYQKFDFVLTVSAALSVFTDSAVRVISDDMRNYRYFDGDVSGVLIGPGTGHDIVVYDCHYAIPPLDNSKLVLCTDYSDHAFDTIKSVQSKLAVDSVIVCTEDYNFSESRIEEFLGDTSLYHYEYSAERKLSCVSDKRLSVKKMDASFIKSVSKFMSARADISASDMREVFAHLKRGT